MSKKEELEKLILESYQIVYKNNQKIFVADPREKSRLRQENDENWEYIKTFLSDYTSLCEARHLEALDDIIDIAATRFSDIAMRLENCAVKGTTSKPSISSVDSAKDGSNVNIQNQEFDIRYNFVNEYISNDIEDIVQFIIKFQNNDSTTSPTLAKHMCLVLDVSGSMNEPNKYPHLVQSIPHLIDSLADEDILTIILFSTHSELIWSRDIGSSRSQKNDIVRKIDQSYIKFQTTKLAPGLRIAIDQIKHHREAEPGAISRLYILTDGQLHDANDCYLLNSELRHLEVEVNSFGFGNDFAENTMREIMEGCPGGRVKWITDTDSLLSEFYHIGEVSRNIIATGAELELVFLPDVTPGDAFRFEPGKYRFDSIDDKSKRFHIRLGSLEKNRAYTYAFEARVYPTQQKNQKIATVQLTYLLSGKKQMELKDIIVNRARKPKQNQQVNKEVETIFLILEEFRTTDPAVLLLSLQTQLKILQTENRYPQQVKLLEKVIKKLELEKSIAVISEEEKRKIRSDLGTAQSNPELTRLYYEWTQLLKDDA